MLDNVIYHLASPGPAQPKGPLPSLQLLDQPPLLPPLERMTTAEQQLEHPAVHPASNCWQAVSQHHHHHPQHQHQQPHIHQLLHCFVHRATAAQLDRVRDERRVAWRQCAADAFTLATPVSPSSKVCEPAGVCILVYARFPLVNALARSSLISCLMHPCLPIFYPCLFLAFGICLYSFAFPTHACCIIFGLEIC